MPPAGLDQRWRSRWRAPSVPGRGGGVHRRARSDGGPERLRGLGRPQIAPVDGAVPRSSPSPARFSVSATGAAAIAPSAPSRPSSTASTSSGAAAAARRRAPAPARAPPAPPRGPPAPTPPGSPRRAPHQAATAVQRPPRSPPRGPAGPPRRSRRRAALARRASTLQASIGRPASGISAFGTAAPMRTPAPAATTIATARRAGRRGAGMGPSSSAARRRPRSPGRRALARCGRWSRPHGTGSGTSANAAVARPSGSARGCEHGGREPVRRHLGLGLPRVEARLLSGGAAAGPLPDPLRRACSPPARSTPPSTALQSEAAVARWAPRPPRRTSGSPQGAPAADPHAGAAPGRGRRRVPRALPRVAGPPREPPRAPCCSSSRPRASATTGRSRALLGCLPPGLPVALEFRHDSWDDAGGARAHRGRGRDGLRVRDRGRGPGAACRRARSATSACAASGYSDEARRGLARAAGSGRPRSGRSTRSPSTRASRPATPTPASGLAAVAGRGGRAGVRRAVAPGIETDDDPARVDLDEVYRFLSEESYWARGAPARGSSRRSAPRRGWWGSTRARGRSGSRASCPTATSPIWPTSTCSPGCAVAASGRALVTEAVEGGPFADCRWLLHTRDAHELYRRLGFSEPDDPTLMQRPPGGASRRSGRELREDHLPGRALEDAGDLDGHLLAHRPRGRPRPRSSCRRAGSRPPGRTRGPRG